MGSFYSLLSRQLPLSCRQRCHLGCPDTTEGPALKESTTMEQETDKQADKCTWRLKSRKTAETHQFVNSTIFNRVITLSPRPPARPPHLNFSQFLSPLFIMFKALKDNFFMQNGQKGAQMTFYAKQIKLNSLLSFISK